MANNLLDWAQRALRQGLHIFPCQPRDKYPVTEHGFKDASTDPKQIEKWWTGTDYNIGISCGASDITVVDVDSGLSSEAEFRAWRSISGLPETYTVHTGRRTSYGVQMYYNGTMPSSGKGKWSLNGCTGEIKSIGGLVIAAGSIHPSGQMYEVLINIPRAPLPDLVRNSIEKKSKPLPTATKDGGKIPSGNWHNLLVSYCGSMVNLGVRTEKGLYRAMILYATENFDLDSTPLDKDHVKQIAASASANFESNKDILAVLESMGVEPVIDDDLPEAQIGEVVRLDNDGTSYVEDPNNGARKRVKPIGTERETYHEPDPDGSKCSKEFEIVRTEKGGIVGIRASDVVERPVDWLWKGRLPQGCGLVVSGPVACNKSMAALALIACVTKGTDWPDGEENTMGPREVLIAATEDDPETTIKPRLMAAGADCDKVIFLLNMFDLTGGERKSRPLRLQEDSKRLYDALIANPKIGMVVLDPLTGFFGDVDGNDNKKIRPMMQNIAKICRLTRTAFVMIIHENKRADAGAVDKILGSGAVSQVVRAGLRFSRDPKNKPDGRIMANIKGNLSKSVGGMRFTVESKDIPSSAGVMLEDIGYIKWGETHEMSADDVMDEARQMKKEEGDDDSKLGVAMKIFNDALAGGKRLHRDVHALLDAADISDATKRRAKQKLGVVSSKSFPWYWWLPEFEEAAQKVDEAKLGDADVL